MADMLRAPSWLSLPGFLCLSALFTSTSAPAQKKGIKMQRQPSSSFLPTVSHCHTCPHHAPSALLRKSSHELTSDTQPDKRSTAQGLLAGLERRPHFSLPQGCP